MHAVAATEFTSELAERTKFVMARFRRRVLASRYRRHIDDLLSIAVTVALQSICDGHSVEWACKAGMRAFWPEIAYERRRVDFADYEPTVARKWPARPIPAWYLARCSTMQEIVLRHKFEADMGDQQIADATGCQRGHVWTHTQRGLKNVRRVLCA